jgi:hypothetical protein
VVSITLSLSNQCRDSALNQHRAASPFPFHYLLIIQSFNALYSEQMTAPLNITIMKSNKTYRASGNERMLHHLRFFHSSQGQCHLIIESFLQSNNSIIINMRYNTCYMNCPRTLPAHPSLSHAHTPRHHAHVILIIIITTHLHLCSARNSTSRHHMKVHNH